jgi:exonuclease III
VIGDNVDDPLSQNQILMNVLFFNTDRRSRTLLNILQHAETCGSKVIGLAETSQGINIDLIKSFNFSVIQSPGLKGENHTAILLHNSLLPNLDTTLNWGHDSGRASAITLNTKHEHLTIAVIYCPTGIDHINNKDPSNVLYQQATDLHTDVNKHVTKSPMSILLADMNETNNRMGRISRSLIDNTITASSSATNESESIMTRHMHSHLDVMKLLHKEEYSNLSANTNLYTFLTTKSIGLQEQTCSLIDFVLVSHSLGGSVLNGQVTDTKHWGFFNKSKNKRKRYTSYHRALDITLTLNGDFWGRKLQEAAPNPNNTNNLEEQQFYVAEQADAMTMRNMAMEVDQEILRHNGLRIIRSNLETIERDQNPEEALNELNTYITEIIIRIAVKHGILKPNTNQAQDRQKKASLQEKFMACTKSAIKTIGRLRRLVGSALHLSSAKEFTQNGIDHRPQNLLDPRIKNCARRLKCIDLTIPDTFIERDWTEWYKASDELLHEYHERLKALSNNKEWSDKDAIKSPKRFLNQVLKEHSSNDIIGLKNNKGEICTAQQDLTEIATEHLEKIIQRKEGGPPMNRIPEGEDEHIEAHQEENTQGRNQNIHNYTRVPDWLARKHSIKQKWYASLLKLFTMEEVDDLLQSIDTSTAAGLDHILPSLLVGLASTTYQTLQRNRTTGDITKQDHSPIGLRSLLLDLANLCQRAQNIPKAGKTSVVTLLPKEGSCITDINNTRPISVSSIITRFVEKGWAKRLSTVLYEHNIIHHAQQAFKLGGNINMPLSTVLSVWEHARTTKSKCVNIFYDIAKAYDSVQWRSIELSMRRIGIPEDFITLMMNSLTGTSARIRINGSLTPEVMANQAIRQGSAIAPLLFIILMDPLHQGYHDIGGYRMEGKKIASRGYADDTWITSNSVKELMVMHRWTCKIFNFHQMALNASKSRVVGRDKTGKSMDIDIPYGLTPLGATQFLKKAPVGTSIKYLGLLINMQLDWSHMIAKLNGILMKGVQAMSSHPMTLVQTQLLIKQKIYPRMGLGLRHAQIPQAKLDKWDQILKATITRIVNHHSGQINKHVLAVAGNYSTIRDLDSIEKISEAIFRLNNVTEMSLSKYDRECLQEATSRVKADLEAREEHRPIHSKDNRLIDVISKAAGLGLSILHNRDHKPREIISQEHKASSFAHYEDTEIPTRPGMGNRHQAYNLWGPKFKQATETKVLVKIATDGSTKKDGSSTAAYVIMDDNLAQWLEKDNNKDPNVGEEVNDINAIAPTGHSWKIEGQDNHAAEFSAANRAIRAIPVSVDLHIVTDSLNTLTAIRLALTPLTISRLQRAHSRPYLVSLRQAIRERQKAGATTTVEHVRAHATVKHKSMEQAGNWWADYMAKEAHKGDTEIEDINLMETEMQFCLVNDLTSKVIHDDIRKAIKDACNVRGISTLTNKPKLGRVANAVDLQSLNAHFAEIRSHENSLILESQVMGLANMWVPHRSTIFNVCPHCNSTFNIDTLHLATCQYSSGTQEAGEAINALINDLYIVDETVIPTHMPVEKEISTIWKLLAPKQEAAQGSDYIRIALETGKGYSAPVRRSAVENAVIAHIQHFHNNPIQGPGNMAMMTRGKILSGIRSMISRASRDPVPNNTVDQTDECSTKHHIAFAIQHAIRLGTGVTHSSTTDALNRACCFETWRSTISAEVGPEVADNQYDGRVNTDEAYRPSFLHCPHEHQESLAVAHIELALLAAETQEKARMVGFVPDTATIRELLDNPHTTIMATYDLASLPWEPPAVLSSLPVETPPLILTNSTCLIVIENEGATALKLINHRKLVRKINDIRDNPHNKAAGRTQYTDNTHTTIKAVNDPIQYFEWYRAATLCDNHLKSNPDNNKHCCEAKQQYPPPGVNKTHTISEHDKLVGAMGMFPQHFKKRLSKSYNVKVTREAAAKIRTIHIMALAKNYHKSKTHAHTLRKRDWKDSG